uniref:Clockwork orange n=1 Tax=Pyrrhocoris apterus TaxID=37000 RepID=A0A8K1ZRI0_PYRAP|nr:clockwork orange [Pyrrhocoris apterus]
MMEHTCWDDTAIKYESHINFTAANTSEDDDYSYGKKKLSRDPLSHRIIEKRRRDRMNNCLADLSRLIPQDYMKKGRGRVEKTEIIEMAIRHMKHLMSHPCAEGTCCKTEDATSETENLARSYRLGYHDCLTETLHFLVDSEGYLASGSLCNQLATHLSQHCDNIISSEGLRTELCRLKEDNTAGYMMSGSGSSGGGQESGSDSSCLTQLSSVNNVSPTSSNSDKCSSVESKCSIESGYKFKNLIQRRFENSIPGPSPPTSSLVPGFALSPRGHYYLPICLDPGLVPREELQGDGEVILHPVTISVNFRPPPLPPPTPKQGCEEREEVAQGGLVSYQPPPPAQDFSTKSFYVI